jgi:ATP-dependent DNA ligase
VVGYVPGEEGKEWEKQVGGILFAVKDKSGKERIIGCVSSMTDEFRAWITVPGAEIAVPADNEFLAGVQKRVGSRKVSYTMRPDIFRKVATIQGQEFTGRNFRLKHCVFSNAYTKGGKFIPWREDKRAEDCVEDIEAVVEKISHGERA